mmetsp:Transcript_10639/g.30273  ORF Transcript_10639/g.30273 Transcript_10639/m.30273 type:complete len:85 (+) Transcript_10639:186-440(+)
MVRNMDPVKSHAVEVMTGIIGTLSSSVIKCGAGILDGKPLTSLADPMWQTAGHDVIIDDGSLGPHHIIIFFTETIPAPSREGST